MRLQGGKFELGKGGEKKEKVAVSSLGGRAEKKKSRAGGFDPFKRSRKKKRGRPDIKEYLKARRDGGEG